MPTFVGPLILPSTGSAAEARVKALEAELAEQKAQFKDLNGTHEELLSALADVV